MIIKEFFIEREDGVKLYRTYSDSNKILLQNETGAEYEEAIDVEDSAFTYTETSKDIPFIDTEFSEIPFES